MDQLCSSSGAPKAFRTYLYVQHHRLMPYSCPVYTRRLVKHLLACPLVTCSVIVSQWTSMLRIVAVHLRRIGLRYDIIDGKVSPKQRMDLVEEFNTNSKGSQVISRGKIFL